MPVYLFYPPLTVVQVLKSLSSGSATILYLSHPVPVPSSMDMLASSLTTSTCVAFSVRSMGLSAPMVVSNIWVTSFQQKRKCRWLAFQLRLWHAGKVTHSAFLTHYKFALVASIEGLKVEIWKVQAFLKHVPSFPTNQSIHVKWFEVLLVSSQVTTRACHTENSGRPCKPF